MQGKPEPKQTFLYLLNNSVKYYIKNITGKPKHKQTDINRWKKSDVCQLPGAYQQWKPS